MIRRADQREKLDKTMFGGPGMAHFTKLLNADELENHGRLYNHLLLRPGDAVGRHRHNGDFEVFFILKGQGLYDDNGSQTTVRAGDVTVCRDGEEHALLNDGPDDLELIALVLFSEK
ncbi:cupin domain-containing protein [Desulfovibrio sp. ZJ200]|uniref:cupin domain-containing protein n=1 Tax=Desulfovibrio sp. ZJ200 TaxID=2709792 RepID=UPI0013EC6562|nr:cupin domain-containing protein [Desulfovibrio sp. ZJ200]